MYELTIIISLAIITGILIRKWFQIRPEVPVKLCNIDYLKKAEQFFEKKNYQEAERHYLQAVLETPDQPLIYGRLGIIYLTQNNLKDAQQALEKAVQLDPANGFYQNNLALVFYRTEKYQEAVSRFKKAIELDNKIAKRWVNLGLALRKVGKREEAKKAFSEALKLEPENKRYQELAKER